MSRQVRTIVDREVKTYAEMLDISWHALEATKAVPGSAYQFYMASLVFTAFSLEAYLNHIGPKVFKTWADLERLGPREKLNIIAEKLSLELDFGRFPWQEMKYLFEFRNDIAHGKTSIQRHSSVASLETHRDRNLDDFVQTRWEKYCTPKNSVRARKNVKEMIRAIDAASGFKDENLFGLGIQIGGYDVFS